MRIRAGVFSLLVLALGVGVARGQSAPKIAGSTPIYLKQGQTIEVAVKGEHLDAVNEALLAGDAGLRAELIDAASSEHGPDTPKPSGEKGSPPATRPAGPPRLRLTAESDAVLGTRELRLGSPDGVSQAVSVTVGQFDQVEDKEPNNAASEAQRTALPASITGLIADGGDVDTYQFTARKGQTLVFDVFANRLGSALDPVVAILDRSGREQPRKVSFRQDDVVADADPTLVFDVPADGDYTLLVRDLQFRGGGAFTYRIDAGEIPLIEAILPAGGRRGERLKVRALGYNLGDVAEQTVDLTRTEADSVPIRVKTSAGWSNTLPLDVSDVAAVPETSPDDSIERAMTVKLPSTVSGVVLRPGEEDFFRFKLETKQAVAIEVSARRDASPLDGLLTLRDAKGKLIEQTNGAGESEARVARALEPGEYVVSIRDLAYGGGDNYSYRLTFARAEDAGADFALRFMPDAALIDRGGNTRLWCEVVRLNGFKDPVAVSLEGLPAGVTVTGGPAVLDAQSSGIFTLSAAPTARLGNVPIRLKGVSRVGNREVVHWGQAESGGRSVLGSYLSVVQPGPVQLTTAAPVTKEQLEQYPAQAQQLYAKLNATSPELEKAQAEWEKSAENAQRWQTVDVSKTESANGTQLTKQADGSLLQTSPAKPTDTFTVIGSASLPTITAVRLEVLPDASLPGGGPGRSAGGNFVLHTFSVSVADKANPKNSRPLKFTLAKATFEQEGFGVAGSLDNNLQRGWAIAGGTGKPQTAWYFPDAPMPAGDVIVTATMIQEFGQEHTIGRFRISLTDDPDVKQRQTDPLPEPVVVALRTATDKRAPDQRTLLAQYYRSVAPSLATERSRLVALENSVGPQAEIQRLESALAAATPGLEPERKAWEQRVSAGLSWVPLDIVSTSAANGTTLSKQDDGSLLAGGPTPDAETYVITGKSALKAVSAIRVEALPDDRLSRSGPGRVNGNFVLTRFQLKLPPPAGKTDPPQVVRLAGARATFEQDKFAVLGALDDSVETGWAIAPLTGVAHEASFVPQAPIVPGPEGTLAVTLEFSWPKMKGLSMGRFRLSVLGSPDDGSAGSVPPEIADILKIPEPQRTPEQAQTVIAYHLSITPALQPTRQRLAELRGRLPSFPVVVGRNKTGSIAVPINRGETYDGPVQVTLEGFSPGRDPATRQPSPIAKNFDITPLTIMPGASFGRLAVKAKPQAEVGTRMVVLRSETKVGNDVFVQYSAAFPLTVTP